MSLKPKDVAFDPQWDKIRKTALDVLTLQSIHRSEWSDRFTDMYVLCTATLQYNAKLYDKTEELLSEHVAKVYETVLASDDLLVSYHKCWSQFKGGIGFLDSLYTYLNVQFIKRQLYHEGEGIFRIEPMKEIGELGLSICKRDLIEPLESKLVHLLIEGIRLDRLGVCPNQTVFHGVILSFVEVEEFKKGNKLELYEGIFETPFLEATGEYYRLEASRLLQESNCSQYMERVLQKLNEEDLRSRKYLHPCSYTKVTQEYGQRMVTDHLPYLLSECRRMIAEENEKDLKNMYLLLRNNSPAFEAMSLELQQYITKKGLEAINDLKGDNIPQVFTENFLAFHDKFSTLIQSFLSGDQLFISALDKASSAVINHTGDPKVGSSAELLAKYCDSLLKKNTKTCSENEVENKLTQTIIPFKYLSDKDVFQKFYSKMMAKRLVHKQSISMEAEELMINKMKLVCGHEFTSKLHRMFTDIKISADLNGDFWESVRNRDEQLDVNFSVSVLTAGAWPLAQAAISTFSIPQQLEKSVQEFEMFYNKRFNGRKLSWLHHLCSGELKLCYLKKPYIVTISTYQMAILLLYERVDVLSYQEISESTKLSNEQLPKQIKSLLEFKLLLAMDQQKPVEAGSSFKLNTQYSNKRLRFKILAVPLKEAEKQEVKQTHASVEADRKVFLQAAIVRIMKQRKVLIHNSLIQEVINQAKERFVPNISMIKKSIETLIDKEYIARTPDSTNEYTYLS